MQPTRSSSCDAGDEQHKVDDCVRWGCVSGSVVPFDLPLVPGHFARFCLRCGRTMVEIIFHAPHCYDPSLVENL